MKSFLQGRKVSDTPALKATRAPGPSGLSSAAGVPGGAAGSGPNIEVVKEGNKVIRIVITCACGERTEVECLYPPGV